jgi:hypothetical protein
MEKIIACSIGAYQDDNIGTMGIPAVDTRIFGAKSGPFQGKTWKT